MSAVSEIRNPVYDNLGDAELLELVRVRGRARLKADWRFAAPLPELERRGLDLKAGFRDLEHLSAVKGGASAQVVARVRNLEAKLGLYPELWRLLDKGEVGWSKLEVIADSVTPETEPEWRWKVLHLSKRALENHVRPLKAKPAKEVEHFQNVALPEVPGSTAVYECRAAGAPAFSPPFREEGPEALPDTPPGPIPGGSDITAETAHPALPGALAASAAEPVDSPTSDPRLPAREAAPGYKKRLSVEIDLVAESRLRELQRQVALLVGTTVSLGDLVSALVHEAWETGALPRVLAGGAQANGDPGLPPEQWAEQAPGEEQPSKHLSSSEEPIDLDDVHPPAAQHQKGRNGRPAIPLPPRGILEVVYREADSSKLLMATSEGLRPVPVFLLDRLPKVTAQYDRLFDAASAASKKAKGDHIPAAVQRAVLARSGGRCEVQGCWQRAKHLHHLVPRAENGSHHPDNVAHLCEADHEAAHSGLLIRTTSGLERRADGTTGSLSTADKAYHQVRRDIQDLRSG